jgi:hypothetical protein
VLLETKWTNGIGRNKQVGHYQLNQRTERPPIPMSQPLRLTELKLRSDQGDGVPVPVPSWTVDICQNNRAGVEAEERR